MLEEKPSLTVDRSRREVVIKFPEKIAKLILKGEAQLFRPSAMGVDEVHALQLDDSGVQRINATNLLKGRWKVKLNWADNNKQYYNEYSINL